MRGELSLLRTRAEEQIVDFATQILFDPVRLAGLEQFWESVQPRTVDNRARVADLERRVGNLVKAIGAGEYSPAVSAALKAAEAELAESKAAAAIVPLDRRAKPLPSRYARA
jgi:hypothetical protein